MSSEPLLRAVTRRIASPPGLSTAIDTVCLAGSTNVKAPRASLWALPIRRPSLASARTSVPARDWKNSSTTQPSRRTLVNGAVNGAGRAAGMAAATGCARGARGSSPPPPQPASSKPKAIALSTWISTTCQVAISNLGRSMIGSLPLHAGRRVGDALKRTVGRQGPSCL